MGTQIGVVQSGTDMGAGVPVRIVIVEVQYGVTVVIVMAGSSGC